MTKIHNQYETEEAVEISVDTGESSVLMLYNDDVNSFEYVIKSLVEICGHELVQAEQVAHIVHTKGKCDVKHGSFPKLEGMCLRLLNRELSATIEPA